MKEKDLLKKYSRQAFELGLVWGTSGNMSIRIDTDSFLITATGKNLEKINDKDLVFCKIKKNSAPERASMEFMLHREIYRLREDVNAILHSQPPFSTLLACAKDKKIRLEIIPEAIAYIKKIDVIPYHHPGSIELARKVREKATRADVLLLQNHGVVSVGSSIEEVINKTVTLEFLCRLTVLSEAAHIELKPIPLKKVTGFLKLLETKKNV